MSRRVYLIAYDIIDDKRRTKIHEACRGFGVRVQYSIFRCHLTPIERTELESELRDLFHQQEDRILFADLGPLEGRGADAITTYGRSHDSPHDAPTIL